MSSKECVINEHITLKLERGQTRIYVNGNYFMHCLKLVLNIPRTDLEKVSELSSIDEFADIYQHRQSDGWLTSDGELIEVEEEDWELVSPEEEFIAHCSNLQAWIEYDYDTRLLKADLAFPLLKKLADEGDERARIRLKEEILKRYESGYKPVIVYLFVEKFFDYLTREELVEAILDSKNYLILKQLEEEFNIDFFWVPNLYYYPEHYSVLLSHRRFSAKNKAITSIDLHALDLTLIPPILTELKKLEIINIKDQNLDLNLKTNMNRLLSLKSLKLIILDKEMLTRIKPSVIQEYDGKKIKLAYDHLKILEIIENLG